MLRATVSGSFHRHMPAVYTVVGELRAAGVDVLSPSDPRIVDHIGEFLFVASDRLRSIKLVQDRHFEAIRSSDFLWVVCPDGYTGASTSAEIGAAHAMGVPVFSDHLPLDITLQHYVRKVPSVRSLIEAMVARSAQRHTPSRHFLLDPETSIENAIKSLERLRPVVTGATPIASSEVEYEVKQTRHILLDSFGRSNEV